jgi:hypothetical protein
MSPQRAMSMQNLTRMRENFSSRGDNNTRAALHDVLISSCFSQFLRNAFDNA